MLPVVSCLQVVGASSSPQHPQQPGDGSSSSSSWPLYLQLSTGDEVGVDLLVQAIGVEPSTDWLPGGDGSTRCGVVSCSQGCRYPGVRCRGHTVRGVQHRRACRQSVRKLWLRHKLAAAGCSCLTRHHLLLLLLLLLVCFGLQPSWRGRLMVASWWGPTCRVCQHLGCLLLATAARAWCGGNCTVVSCALCCVYVSSLDVQRRRTCAEGFALRTAHQLSVCAQPHASNAVRIWVCQGVCNIRASCACCC